ncbi:MAG: hypothetical protein RMJ87_13770 [Cytophagales bacterium]|nr:hypothetical protein [Bernardetiaceae bacterium]MDW8206091.1 hypothetical protein [Cytophagales bacterium]
MELLYSNPYIEISIDKPNGIIEMAWLPETSYMSDEEFKAAFSKYADLVEEHHPFALITYSRGSNYAAVPELQEWVATNIVPRAYQAGVMYTAIVVVEDVFAQVAAEQLVEEPEVKQHITTHFFPSVAAAREWLMKKKPQNDK